MIFLKSCCIDNLDHDPDIVVKKETTILIEAPSFLHNYPVNDDDEQVLREDSFNYSYLDFQPFSPLVYDPYDEEIYRKIDPLSENTPTKSAFAFISDKELPRAVANNRKSEQDGGLEDTTSFGNTHTTSSSTSTSADESEDDSLTEIEDTQKMEKSSECVSAIEHPSASLSALERNLVVISDSGDEGDIEDEDSANASKLWRKYKKTIRGSQKRKRNEDMDDQTTEVYIDMQPFELFGADAFDPQCSSTPKKFRAEG